MRFSAGFFYCINFFLELSSCIGIHCRNRRYKATSADDKLTYRESGLEDLIPSLSQSQILWLAGY